MQNFIAYHIQLPEGEKRDALVATLMTSQATGVEENEQECIAWFPEGQFDESAVLEVLQKAGVGFEKKFMPAQNWNAIWEAGFEPVIIAGKVAIRAAFHAPIPGMLYEIIITPKMSFGTGHHATTSQVISAMLSIDFSGKRVFDFGAGTGILSILTHKMGAAEVIAIDNDPLCAENFLENLAANHCTHVFFNETDTPPVLEQFDIILANINKAVILHFLPQLTNMLTQNGYLLLSGILKEDEQEILEKSGQCGLKYCLTNVKENWLYIQLQAQNSG